MEQQQLLQSDFLDILFDRRNKQYGSYELRRNYPGRARRAALLVVTGALLTGTIPLIAGLFPASRNGAASAAVHTAPTVLTDVVLKKAAPVIPPAPAAAAPARIAPTVRHTSLVIRPTADVRDDAPRPVDSMGNRMAGRQDHPGHADGVVAAAGQPDGAGTRSANNTAGVELNRSAGPAKWVEQMPQFDGDVNAYLQRNLRYPEDAQQSGREGRVVVQFVVNADGSISNAEVIRSVDRSLDREALRVVNGMPRWKPGRQNGQPVPVYFMLPVSFVIN